MPPAILLAKWAARGNPVLALGEVEGRRVDVVWERRDVIRRATGGHGTSGMHSGVRFTVRHDDLGRGLSVQGRAALARMLARPEHAATLHPDDRAALGRLFETLPHAQVDDTGVRLGRRRDNLAAAGMIAAVRAMVRASR